MFNLISSIFHSPQTTYKLNIHPRGDGIHVAQIDVEGYKANKSSSLVETIIILDRRVPNFPMVLTYALPKAFSKLGYADNQKIFVIVFHDYSTVFEVTVGNLKIGIEAPLDSWEKSSMAPAIKSCKDVLAKIGNNKPIRIMVITGACVQNDFQTWAAADDLMDFLKDKDYTINSQVILYMFKDKEKYDENVVSIMLQANNTTKAQMVKIYQTIEGSEYAGIPSKIKKLFKNDKLDFRRMMSAKEEIFMKAPWDPSPVNKILLKSGENIFWLKEIPKEEIKVGDAVVDVVIKSAGYKKKSLERAESQLIEMKIAEEQKEVEVTPVDSELADDNKRQTSKVKSKNLPKHVHFAKTKCLPPRYIKRHREQSTKEMIQELKEKLNDLKHQRRSLGETSTKRGQSSRKSLISLELTKMLAENVIFQSVAEIMVNKNVLWCFVFPVIAVVSFKFFHR